MDVVLMNTIRQSCNLEVKRSLGVLESSYPIRIELCRRHSGLPKTNWAVRCGLRLKRRNPYEHIPCNPEAR